MTDQLKPTELCCLLNYCLGLPVISNRRNVMAPEIPVVVIGSWTAKIQQRVERWVEREMREAGALPEPPRRTRPVGRPFEDIPQLATWIPAGMKAAFYARRKAA